jgi:hypothetical protein
MSYPFSTIGLPPDAGPAEVDAAYEAFKARAGSMTVAEAARLEEAFLEAKRIVAERDPSYLPYGTDYPNPWREAPKADGATPPAEPPSAPASAPLPSADMLATTLLGLVRQAPDFEALLVALRPVKGWMDAGTRAGADRHLREWLADGGDLSAAQVVRLARLFDWSEQSPVWQSPDRDAAWRERMRQANAIMAPPPAEATDKLGRIFLIVGGVAGVGLALLLLPRLLGGGFRILVPLAIAGLAAWLLIRWGKQR